MNHLETYYTILVVIQLLHSQEEIFTRFDRQWPLWKMSRLFFVIFEIIFSIFIILPLFLDNFPLKNLWMQFFNILMFANGIWHLTWAGIEKRYVPGAITATIFILVYLVYYFGLF